jgi:phage shock protein PspC (stress-responsive transcriptional regulator)
MEGRDEIISDIESRIAELLQEKMVDNKQVITIQDIEEVVKILGEPSEMENEDDYEPQPKSTYRNRPRRLYRDPDNRMIAGVSSGLAAYFNIDPVWLRVLFIATLFISGAGLIAYIILWIVVPQALTTAEKLEMRGEPVNISNIERSFRDEFDNVKDKFNEFADGAKDTFKKKSAGSRTVFDNLIDFTGGALRIILKVAIVIIGLILILSGLGFITAFVVGTAGLSSFSFFENGELISFSLATFLEAFFPGPVTGVMSVIAFILLFGIPLIMMVYLGIRMIAGTRARVPYIGITAFGFWLAGLVMAIIVTAATAMDFRHSAIITNEVEMNIDTSRILYVKAKADPAFGNGLPHTKTELFDEWKMRMFEDGYDIYAVPDFSASSKTFVEGSMLVVSSYAKGSSRKEADESASALFYPVEFKDSVLYLPTWYHFPPNGKIRAQDMRLKLRIPEGQVVHFDENLEEFFDENPNYYYRREGFEGNTWIMTSTGLKPYFNGKTQDTESYLQDTDENDQFPAKTLSMISIPLIGL